MRTRAFSIRNIKEILRDPVSYIFSLGFPIIMLVIMTIVNMSIPPEAHMTIFQIQNLAPGIAVFGLSFIMLFTCLSVSKDRSSTFLVRLYASPMKGRDFISGYTLPFMIIAIGQCILTFLASIIIGLFTDYSFTFANLFLSLLVLLPSMLLFISLGLLFGTLFKEKAAPALCSIIISIVGLVGGIWMNIDGVKGPFAAISKVLPFYQGVKAARMAINGQFAKIGTPLLIVILYAIVFYLIAVLAFRSRMQTDLK